MAVLQALVALVTRSLGRIMSAMFGWAVTALFGQTAPSEQTFLSALVGAAAAWPVLLLGIAVPKIAVWVLGFVPLPESVPRWVVRVAWIALAAAIPLAIGLTMALRRRRGRTLSRADAPGTRERPVVRLLRGFPTTLGIAAAFFVMFITVPALRLSSLVRRRVDVQVPLVTDREHYGRVADEVARVLALHGFSVARAEPGWWMTVPSRILLALGGPAFRDQIPERLAYFRSDRLEVALYPNGLLLRGNAQDTAWAHGIVVEELTEAPALQTFDPRAQEIERQIRRVWSVFRENPPAHRRSGVLERRLDEISTEIGRAPISYEEWQIVYRQALQLGRALEGDMQLMAATSSNHRAGVDARAVEEDQMRSYSTPSSARELSNRELLGEITGRASLLARKEIELAKAELRADFKAQLSMVTMVAVAAVIALIGINILVVAGVLALQLVIAGWLAGLIVAVVLLAVAGIVGYIGSRRLVTNPLAVTRQSLKEDVRWVKERLA